MAGVFTEVIKGLGCYGLTQSSADYCGKFTRPL